MGPADDSKPKAAPRTTVRQIAKRKGGTPVVCLTAYSAPFAEILDPLVDLLLVGDSLGTVVHGRKSTVGVTLEMMILHAKAVMRGSRRACVVVDLPFSSYEESPAQAFRNASRILAETGCQAVKLEGGVTMAPTIEFLVRRGVPVMAHIGLQPQSSNLLGYAARGRRHEEWDAVIADAEAVAQAGAFATVLEAVAESLAAEITAKVANVTIGIGASASCDGQILVTEDMLGLFPQTPSFVKRYAELRGIISEAVEGYAREVRERTFPDPDHTYDMKD